MLRSMKLKSVVISKACLSFFRSESLKAKSTETGGPLVGFVAENEILVIVDATGPGPRAILERFSVTIDGKHAQMFCDKIRQESNGRIDYVGDWHKHTGLSLSPSHDDVAAIKTMAHFEFSPTKQPVSLIYRDWPQALQVYVWNAGDTLVKIPWNICPEKMLERFLN